MTKSKLSAYSWQLSFVWVLLTFTGVPNALSENIVPHCIRVALTRSNSANHFTLGIGDEVTLNLESQSQMPAFFLGKSNGKQGKHYFFVEPHTGRILYADEEEVQLDLTSSVKVDATSWRLKWKQLVSRLKPKKEIIISEIVEKAPETLQNIVKLETQRGQDCAAHSLYHCLLLLDDLDKIFHPDIKTILRNNPKLVLKEFQKDYINAENQPSGWTITKRYIKKQIWDRRTVLHPEPSQIESRMQLLKELGLEAENTRNPEQIREHLRSGNPVLMDVMVKQSKFKIYRVGQSDFVENYISELCTQPGELCGYHAVLAVAFISEKNATKGKYLVWDSDPAGFYLWDSEDLDRSFKTQILNRGSLVKIPTPTP